MSGCPVGHGAPAPTDGAAQQQQQQHHHPRAGGGSFAGTSSILGFQTTEGGFIRGEAAATDGRAPTHYSSYLAVPELLQLQSGVASSKPGGQGLMHHEELTFIIVHQVFELWFKLVGADLGTVREILTELQKHRDDAIQQHVTQCVQYLRRAEMIFHHVQGTFGVIESMHPGDFIEFRDYLVPASGFQSVSFRSLEQLLGVPNHNRQKVNGQTVFSYLKPEEQVQLEQEQKAPSLSEILIKILSTLKVPENFAKVYLETNSKLLRAQQYEIAHATANDPKAEAFIKQGEESLASMMNDPCNWAEGLFVENEAQAAQFKLAVIGALYVTSYRHEPKFAQMAQLLDSFIAVEESFLLWRGRHSHMAERMIGRRTGTGGSSGVGYLDITRKYRIFHCLWLMRKMLIRASALPPLAQMEPTATPLFA